MDERPHPTPAGREGQKIHSKVFSIGGDLEGAYPTILSVRKRSLSQASMIFKRASLLFNFLSRAVIHSLVNASQQQRRVKLPFSIFTKGLILCTGQILLSISDFIFK